MRGQMPDQFSRTGDRTPGVPATPLRGTDGGWWDEFLASLGFTVEAIDFSAQAIGWARQRADRTGVAVSFQHCSIFDAQFTDGSYDLVYDSGCFHHLPRTAAMTMPT
jgi:2-polyprenyl-3-methyl-5-hydroxy-6-metoxy-1,4-benzoquinol methylase